MDNVSGFSSTRIVSRNLGVPYSTMQNVWRKMVLFFPYKIYYNQQLLPIDREKRLTFALTFWLELKWMHRRHGRFYGAMKYISI